MEFNLSFPRELNKVKEERIPFVMCGGTVEYHGPHCSYGCDTLIAEGLIKKLAEKKDIMIAPTIYYSPASYAVADETSGTVHIEEDIFEDYKTFNFNIIEGKCPENFDDIIDVDKIGLLD